ncbi:MAG: hypothetical protein K2X66_14625 [Cyanobacteria bacterium]|jgi:hypothetical protein|nr:hypothetical protein [Cyanobacteriota bacterium]
MNNFEELAVKVRDMSERLSKVERLQGKDSESYKNLLNEFATQWYVLKSNRPVESFL